MKEINLYDDALQKGGVLKIYILELKQNIEMVYQASFLHRNPYIRTRLAKQQLQAVLDSIQHCQDSIFLYMAALAKIDVCSKQEMNAYFFVYQFLFEFQDDIKKQEWLHLLMVKNTQCSEKFETFITYSIKFMNQQEQQIARLRKTTCL